MRIAVVGGGISGLSAAYRLLEARPDCEVTLFEHSARLGGVVESRLHQGVLCELGPDSMLRKPALMRLIGDLNLDTEVVETQEPARRALVVRAGRLFPIPEGFYLLAPGRLGPFLRSPLISLRGKLRMALDLVLPARGADAPEESLAQFVVRRLGRECLQRLAQPLVAGITTADPEQLSVAAVFPQLVRMERRHRSLLMAMRARSAESPASGARYGLFVSFAGGMSRLVDRLGQALEAHPRFHLQRLRAVTALTREPGPASSSRSDSGFVLQTSQGPWAADRVVLALPAPRLATLVHDLDSELARQLSMIPYASVATVTLAWPRAACRAYPQAAGFVVPAVESSGVIAATFVDRKFAHRAPSDQIVVRAFIGGALDASALDADDQALSQLAARELARLLGIDRAPLWSVVARHPSSMPQYTLGHRERVAALRSRLTALPGLALLGNGFDGIGIGDLCAASDRLAEAWQG
jgi:oxygen-dependent protoporphyrinogen oxidase